jgi:hypothetical protein
MARYRAYLIGRDSYFNKAVDLDCADDDAAKKRAERMVDGHYVELGSTPAGLQNLTASENSPTTESYVVPPLNAETTKPRLMTLDRGLSLIAALLIVAIVMVARY